MWSSSSTSDVDQLFPRRPRRVSSSSAPSLTSRSSATSCFEQRRRDLPPHSVSTGSLWAFNGSSTRSGSFYSSSADSTGYQGVEPSSLVIEEPNEGLSKLESGVKAADHGVIGSYPSVETTARMLWNRPEREEEEREEEALPSYLSYLQASSFTGDATAKGIPTTASFNPVTALDQTSDDQMETKSKELTRALQRFISMQIQGEVSTSSALIKNSGGGCKCEKRVEELEKQVKALFASQKEERNSATMKETGNALGDRVSTLEGRQSAFQSQLAQISKVLGVPVGKHGKSSQLKTLVQTLHTEIDTKVQEAIANMNAACVAGATTHAEKLNAEAADIPSASSPTRESLAPSSHNEKKEKQNSNDCDSIPISSLSFSTVLNTLAKEHEASLMKLNTHFDERLRLEGSQRVALEGRVQARLGELEEWLQQVEGEISGSRFEQTPSSSIAGMADEMTRLEANLAKMEIAWKHQQQEVKELFAKVEKLPNLEDLRTQLDQQNDDVNVLRKNLDIIASSTREETRAVARISEGLKLIVEKLMRDTGSAEELLQQYVSTITHQVASVTRQYVSVRIRDNNRLLDATLRARIPDYVSNESESFLLVHPDRKEEGDGHNLGTEVVHEPDEDENVSFVLCEDDGAGVRCVLTSQHGASKPNTISTSVNSDASAVDAAAGPTASS
ncbi:unnamed protein product [Peronospora farinosa]|uniref:Uncharacterized protein n=1 Tax=Peronospora farinosa TaxID=134698 RepID=A0ABN8C2A6_9STRA|nr:unnamed protein product [Peronospora farinosa]